MITQERKAELLANSFQVEDMTAVWGSGWWDGQFRFLKFNPENGKHTDTGNAQPSEEAAWADASQYLEKLNASA